MASEQVVDPWNVKGEIDENGVAKAIDYKKIVDQFGTKLIDAELLQRFERATGHKPHRFMRRGIVFSHRDLEAILDRYEKGEPFFLYTGRGPSSDSMHIGHTIPFEFTKWLQDVFDVPLVIMLTDDEKYLTSEKVELEDAERYSRQNAMDIIAIGFDPKKTFIYSDYSYMGGDFYRNCTRIAKYARVKDVAAIFGVDGESTIGKANFPSVQGAASFASSYPHIFGPDKTATNAIPCLIPCAIDQDPYFRLTRDFAASSKFAKPSLIHARFLDALQGPGSKMSASVETSAIFMKDTAKRIKDKVNKYAYSGGQIDVAEHRRLGGDTTRDVAYQYLNFFLEDDEELERIGEAYRKGDMLTGEMKAKCIESLQAYVKEFQDRRAHVTEETVDLYMGLRALEWKANPNPIKSDLPERPKDGAAEGTEDGGAAKLTKNQLKKLEKEKMIAEKKARQAAEKAAATATATKE